MAAPLVLLIVPAVRVTAPEPSALALLIFNVPLTRVTPPAAPELFPLKVNVPPAAFIVVRPSYVLAPERTVAPVPVTVTAPAMADPPFAITLETVVFPAPVKVKMRDVSPEEFRSIPPLKTMAPPAKEEDQLAFPPSLITLLLKVWVAVESFVMAPLLRTVMSSPDHV